MRWSPAQHIPGGLRLQEGAAATLSQEVSPGWGGAWGWGAGLAAMGLEHETGARWACIPECVRVPDASVTLFYVLCPSLRGGVGGELPLVLFPGEASELQGDSWCGADPGPKRRPAPHPQCPHSFVWRCLN